MYSRDSQHMFFFSTHLENHDRVKTILWNHEGGIMVDEFWEAFGSIWVASEKHLRSVWEHMGGIWGYLAGRSG